MPRSVTRGPSGASTTVSGVRSRCAVPAAWIASSASASPTPSSCWSSGGSGPLSATTSRMVGASTYSVANQGSSARRSPSRTAVTRGLRTR